MNLSRFGFFCVFLFLFSYSHTSHSVPFDRIGLRSADDKNKDRSQFFVVIFFFREISTMEACDGVEREVSKVAEKFHGLNDIIDGNLDESIQLISAAKNELQFGKKKFNL